MAMRATYMHDDVIYCILVGEQAHGQKYIRNPDDAYYFRMHKIPPLTVSIARMNESPSLVDPYEILEYQPFTEISGRHRREYIRLFSVNGQAMSVLQIADALRIAGIHEL